jgi:deazaflavin-dependent oxidoreductase (nitroreductase family)
MFRLAMKAQVFLLRRNWIGPLSEVLMVITTTGRKSGRPFTIPIGYLRDGDSVLAFNRGGGSNWYKNVLHNPEVTLVIQGKAQRMRGAAVSDPAEIARVIDRYCQAQPDIVKRFWGFDPAAGQAERIRGAEHIRFVRFMPV